MSSLRSVKIAGWLRKPVRKKEKFVFCVKKRYEWLFIQRIAETHFCHFYTQKMVERKWSYCLQYFYLSSERFLLFSRK